MGTRDLLAGPGSRVAMACKHDAVLGTQSQDMLIWKEMANKEAIQWRG